MSKKRFSSDETILALDLGTSCVKAVMARPCDNETLEIIGSGIAKQFSSSMNAGAIMDIPAVTSACEQAIGAAEKISDIRAKTAIVGISGEFVKSKTSTIRYRRSSQDSPISEAEMSLLLKKVQEKNQEIARKEISIETASPNAEIRLINSSVVSVEIDGCSVNNPIGFRGSEVKVRFYTAFAPLVQVSAIEKVCAELSLDLLAIAVEPFAISRAYIKDGDDTSCIMIDVGDGTTDVALVEKGGIDGTQTFSIGADSFKKDSSMWLSGLEIVLEELASQELPPEIILSGGGSKNLDLCELLAVSDWYKKLKFSHRPSVSLLDNNKLVGFSYDASVFEINELYITALGLLRVACDILADAPDRKLHHKLAKLLQH